MGIIGGTVGYHILRRLCPTGETGYMDGSVYQGKSKLEVLFGERIWDELAGKVVIDFGCGTGQQCVEMAQHGAKKVIGLDMRESVLAEAREAAERAGVSDRCVFTTEAGERADVIVSLDAFEHFDDPAGILRVMRTLVRDDGCALIEFGPTWYHPLGGHLFSVFPWAHLIFTEKALIRWRTDFKTDGATRFREIEGGLNQMTIGHFERLVAASAFRIDTFEAVPIRRARFLWTPATREFFTAIVRCRLVPRGSAAREREARAPGS